MTNPERSSAGSGKPLLVPGDTVWRVADATRASLLMDAADYFATLRDAMRRARHSIWIAGWDIDSRVRMAGEKGPADDDPVRFRDLLCALAERRPELDIRLLLWDYSVVYAAEREAFTSLRLDWRTPDNVRIELDGAVPAGASHHQKLAVVDNGLAFCGGLDLTVNRWDTRDHRPVHPERRDPDGDPYPPFHDLQMAVSGPVASVLGDLFRQRWRRATGEHMKPVAASSASWPSGLGADFTQIGVGVARTRAAYEDEPFVGEIEASYKSAIEAARRHIYIENQYFTSPAVADALLARLRSVPDLEVVVVTPARPQGWLEEKTMGAGQADVMGRFRDAGFGERIRFVHPVSGEGEAGVDVMVHAKAMIVDDRLLRVGSANLNRRSMGLDSECDLVFEARDAAERAVVRGLLGRLLGHHLGWEARRVTERLSAGASLADLVDAGRGSTRRLVDTQPAEEHADALADALNTVADPREPLDPARLVGDLFAPSNRSEGGFARWSWLAGLAVVTLGGLLLWRETPLAEWADPQQLARWLEEHASGGQVFLLLLAAFVAGGFVFFPLTALIAAAGLVLGPWLGLACAFVGSMSSAMLSYALGRGGGRDVFGRFFGERMEGVRDRLGDSGVVAVAGLRMVPVAPFTLVNLSMGALGIRPRIYAAGTLLGLLPGLLVLTVMGDRLRELLRQPGPEAGVWLGAAVLAWVAMAWGFKWLLSR